MSELVALELGFDAGTVLRVSVPASEATKLERSFGDGASGAVTLPIGGGKLIIDLGRLVYLLRGRNRADAGFTGEAR